MSYEEAEDFRKLLQKLDRKATISWLPEMKAGRPVYDYLRRSLESEDLSRHQKANILHALFRLRSHVVMKRFFLQSHAFHVIQKNESEVRRLPY